MFQSIKQTVNRPMADLSVSGWLVSPFLDPIHALFAASGLETIVRVFWAHPVETGREVRCMSLNYNSDLHTLGN